MAITCYFSTRKEKKGKNVQFLKPKVLNALNIINLLIFLLDPKTCTLQPDISHGN